MFYRIKNQMPRILGQNHWTSLDEDERIAFRKVVPRAGRLIGLTRKPMVIALTDLRGRGWARSSDPFTEISVANAFACGRPLRAPLAWDLCHAIIRATNMLPWTLQLKANHARVRSALQGLHTEDRRAMVEDLDKQIREVSLEVSNDPMIASRAPLRSARVALILDQFSVRSSDNAEWYEQKRSDAIISRDLVFDLLKTARWNRDGRARRERFEPALRA